MEGDVEDGELSDSDSDMPGAGSPGEPQQVGKGRWQAARPGLQPELRHPWRRVAEGPVRRTRREGRSGPAAARGAPVPARGREVLDGPAGERGRPSRGGARRLRKGGPRYRPGGWVRGPFPWGDCFPRALVPGTSLFLRCPFIWENRMLWRGGGGFCCCWALGLVSKGECSPVPLVASRTIEASRCKTA